MANRTLWRSDEEADGFAEVYMSESGSIVGVRASGDVEEHEAYADCIRHLAGALDAATRERDEARASNQSLAAAMNAVAQCAADDRSMLCAVLAPDVDPSEPGAAGLLLERARQTVEEVERLQTAPKVEIVRPVGEGFLAGIVASVDRQAAADAERARIVAWLRTYDEASTHDEVSRMLAMRIERGEYAKEDG
jgi:hypothetical protein